MASGPIDARSKDPQVAAVKGTQTGSGGFGVWGDSITGAGVAGTSISSVGVDAKTQSGPAALRAIHAGDGVGVLVACHGNGHSGVWGDSKTGPGVSGTSNSSVGVDATTQSGPAALRAVHAGDGVGVLGACHGNGHSGVWGDSKTGPGVSGTSNSSVGVDATTQSGPAALRAIHAGDGVGVLGACHGNGHSGVWGDSKTGPGVSGTSNSSVGVDAKTQTGPAALRAVHAGGGIAGFFQGDVEVTGDIRLLNADCAEEFDVASVDDAPWGTVMVLNDEGSLCPNRVPYDRRVVGVISGGGDYKPAIVLDRKAGITNRRPIALMGKVYCKVDAQYAAIAMGDLLTTSPTLGHAMKADDPIKAFGAVIGKALRPLNSGQGLIPVLVALQ